MPSLIETAFLLYTTLHVLTKEAINWQWSFSGTNVIKKSTPHFVRWENPCEQGLEMILRTTWFCHSWAVAFKPIPPHWGEGLNHPNPYSAGFDKVRQILTKSDKVPQSSTSSTNFDKISTNLVEPDCWGAPHVITRAVCSLVATFKFKTTDSYFETC